MTDLVEEALGTGAYLGQFPIDISTTKYANYTPRDWAMTFIIGYGGIDGSHHKAWVIDQVSRVLCGTPVIVEAARWSPSSKYPTGLEELRFWTGEPSSEYNEVVRDAKYDSENDDPEGYKWDIGTAP